MGFKSKARKKRAAADAAAGRTGKDKKEEFEGQVRCGGIHENFRQERLEAVESLSTAQQMFGVKIGLKAIEEELLQLVSHVTENGRRPRRMTWMNGLSDIICLNIQSQQC